MINIVDKLILFAKNEILFDDYTDQRSFDLLLDFITDYKEALGDPEQLVVYLDLLVGLFYLEMEDYSFLETNGFKTIYRDLKAIVTILTKDVKIRSLLKLYELYTELDEVEEDLQREKRKYEVKLKKESQGNLLKELLDYKENYRKDSILMIEGLLQDVSNTDEKIYISLKSQLDRYYRDLTQTKMIELNKTINLTEKVVINEQQVKNIVLSYKTKIVKLQKKLVAKK